MSASATQVYPALFFQSACWAANARSTNAARFRLVIEDPSP
jgi:hypothetical protein